ncbi:phage tail protein [Bradyrhizobium betae]|uniref:Phage tail protein n=1 Tax=Bradyrhizobium betae TaxID=244734 RepID=A0A5P6PEL3_9BRAD|nr:tail fiber protein [Bradyrhizobium betae]MCS3726142.1 microcystin-dependent protein [Bradyrhizobium betae]QFI76777.1 phage tail protein [Bradyrhizobium betae]
MPLQPILGQIMPFAGTTVPRGWALCNGALMAIQTNQALFSLLGTYYGGDGIRTFGLPDLRGRAIIGSSGASGNFPAGMTSGAVAVTLNAQQLPTHNHIIQASTTQGSGRGTAAPANNLFGTNTSPPAGPKSIFLTAGSGETPLAPGTNVLNEGGNQSHNNMQPYLVINYMIALNGIFPSRD